MADVEKDTAVHNDSSNGSQAAAGGHSNPITRNMSHEERGVAEAAARFGYGPLSTPDPRLAGFGGPFTSQPIPQARKLANPAPFGLCGFALTTFVLSLINMEAGGITTPNLVVASAFGYGGLVQLLAGMWEVACGNTFGATAFSSYGGFWISYAIIYTPGGFEIASAVTEGEGESGLNYVVGFWLMGWFIFTLLMLICTVKSSIVFFSLFFTLDLAFLFLAIGHFVQEAPGKNQSGLIKAGGLFGLLAAFLAWYAALCAIADTNNSFVNFPMFEFPWNPSRKKTERETV